MQVQMLLSEELELLRETAPRFAEQEIAPRADEIDRDNTLTSVGTLTLGLML